MVSNQKYELVCDELSETVEENKTLKFENAALQLENERLYEMIDKFNKALKMLGGVK